MRNINLQPINEAVAEVKSDLEREIARYKNYIKEARKEAKVKIKEIETARPILADLDAAGVDMTVYRFGTTATIDLGFFPCSKAGNARLAAEVRRVRLAVGCKLAKTDRLEIADAGKKHVRYELRAENLDIRVTFVRKLARTAKCKIVTKTEKSSYTRLVCEA